MSELATAIFLAIVQGLTEFLPISSSGHLVLLQHITGFANDKLLFNVVVHMGTLVAVTLYFFKDLKSLVIGAVNEIKIKKKGDNIHIIIAIVIANIPAAIVGLFFRDFFLFIYKMPIVISLMLLITGVLLVLTKKLQNRGKYSIQQITLVTAFIIGLSQAIAILPGISRSGMTVATAMFLMVNKNSAARFSFIMSIPITAGAFLLETLHVSDFMEILAPTMIISALVAFVVGLLSLKMLTLIISKNKFYLFSYYLFPVGIISLLYFAFF